MRLLPIDSSTLLADCALHLQQRIKKVKAGPQPGGITLHPINMDRLAPPVDIAHRFYSLVLTPICTGIVFFATEFQDIKAIIRLLARWARNLMGQTTKYRPCIIIVSNNRTVWPPGDAESWMTAGILVEYNPTRELTAKAANAI